MGLFDAFKKKDKGDPVLKAYENGKAIPLSEVNDPTFSKEILGPGVAIIPEEGILAAPCNGKVSLVADTCHAVSITADNGAEILMHLGIDTVELKGEHFEALVKVDQKVSAGDTLIKFDIDKIKELGYDVVTPLIVCNHAEMSNVETLKTGDIKIGEDILKVEK